MIASQNTAYRNKAAEYNRSAPENVLLQYLIETVPAEGFFRSDQLHTGFVKDIVLSGTDSAPHPHTKVTAQSRYNLLHRGCHPHVHLVSHHLHLVVRYHAGIFSEMPFLTMNEFLDDQFRVFLKRRDGFVDHIVEHSPLL